MPTMLPFFILALLFAQGAPKKPVETAHLSVTTSASPAAPAAGLRLGLHVDVTPKPNMHVYSPGQEGSLAVSLTLDANAPVAAAGKAKFPAGEKYVMPALNETQLVYSKPFRITQDVRIREGAPPGPLTIKGTLRYQACDDKICYLPKDVAVEWTVSR
jgi:DsbC/DsbD-like thiol-disulfide interchange protein